MTDNETTPSATPLPAPAAQTAAIRTIGWPWFTLLLIALLGVIFVFEIGLNNGTGTTPTLDTLTTMGGLFRPLVLSGEWWRIVTAPLLHADPSHIFFNCLALLLIGVRLEPLIGWRWFAGIFAVSAICGSLLSLLINPPTIVGVGASGGIVGLFVAAMIVSTRIPDPKARARLITRSASSLVPALLPFIGGISAGSGMIDYGAHFGGAIGGAVTGIVALRLWPKALARPTRATLAAMAAAAFLLVAAGAIVPISAASAEVAMLVPHWPEDAHQATQARDLAAKYPHDPRVRLNYGASLMQQNQISAAETELRAALAETDILHRHFPPLVENTVRAALAVVLVEEAKTDEAKGIVGSACTEIGLAPQMKAELEKDKLCAPAVSGTAARQGQILLGHGQPSSPA